MRVPTVPLCIDKNGKHGGTVLRVRARHLPDEVIECRSKVMDAVAYQQRPLVAGHPWRILNSDKVAGAFGIASHSGHIGILSKERVDMSFEGVEMAPCPFDLGPTTAEIGWASRLAHKTRLTPSASHNVNTFGLVRPWPRKICAENCSEMKRGGSSPLSIWFIASDCSIEYDGLLL